MESLPGIGANIYGTDVYRRGRSGIAAENGSAGAVPTRTGAGTVAAPAAGAMGGAQPPVRPSLLVALQEVRVNEPSDEKAADGEATTETAGLFAADDAADETPTVIDEIMDKGFAEWAHEKWLERIREEARQSALSGMGMTEEDVAALPPEMQEQVERLIKAAVDEAVRRATEQAAEQNGEERSGQAKVLNPIVTGG